VIGVVIGTFLLGWLLSSLRPVPPVIIATADKYVLRLALPALILAKLSTVELNADLALPIAIAWTLIVGAAVVIIVCGRIFSVDQKIVGALLLVAVLGNTSFLGLEMVHSLLGAEHMPSAIAFDQLGTFLGLSLWGSYVASRYGAGESGWRPLVRRLSRFVPFLAVLASVPLRMVDLPDIGYDMLNTIGRTVAPVAMGALGLRFTLRISSRVAVPALLGLVLKMLVMPGAVYVVATIAGSTHDLAWSTSIMQAAAPPMVTAGVVAVSAGLSEELVAFMVGIGTLVAFVSIPLLSLIL
jgi:predicted permease